MTLADSGPLVALVDAADAGRGVDVAEMAHLLAARVRQRLPAFLARG